MGRPLAQKGRCGTGPSGQGSACTLLRGATADPERRGPLSPAVGARLWLPGQGAWCWLAQSPLLLLQGAKLGQCWLPAGAERTGEGAKFALKGGTLATSLPMWRRAVITTAFPAGTAARGRGPSAQAGAAVGSTATCLSTAKRGGREV